MSQQLTKELFLSGVTFTLKSNTGVKVEYVYNQVNDKPIPGVVVGHIKTNGKYESGVSIVKDDGFTAYGIVVGKVVEVWCPYIDYVMTEVQKEVANV